MKNVKKIEFDVLIAKKSMKVFFIVDGEGTAKDIKTVKSEGKVLFSLSEQPFSIDGLTTEVMDLLEKGRGRINVRDLARKQMTEAKIPASI